MQYLHMMQMEREWAMKDLRLHQMMGHYKSHHSLRNLHHNSHHGDDGDGNHHSNRNHLKINAQNSFQVPKIHFEPHFNYHDDDGGDVVLELELLCIKQPNSMTVTQPVRATQEKPNKVNLLLKQKLEL